MSLDPSINATGNTLYFGPLAGYDTEELDRRGLNQDKKTLKGFEWFLIQGFRASINNTNKHTTKERDICNRENSFRSGCIVLE